MKNYSQLFLFSLGVSLGALFLTSCRTVMDPTVVPAGYTRSGEYYKSAEGPEADDLGYEYSRRKNTVIVNAWKKIAADMIDKVQTEAAMVPDTIYVEQNTSNAFNNSFDHALRQALIERGFYVTNTPGATYNLSYDAYPEGTEIEALRQHDYNDGLHARESAAVRDSDKYVLTLHLAKEGQLLGSGSGLYNPPPYGYDVKGL